MERLAELWRAIRTLDEQTEREELAKPWKSWPIPGRANRTWEELSKFLKSLPNPD
jgi:hypothetical protein